jgi:hypothetical protein
MSGNLLNQAREINNTIINSGGFESEISFEAKTENKETALIMGTIRLHSTSIDPETGVEITGRTASVLVSISDLLDESYPIYRDSKNPNEIVMKDDSCTFLDASGNSHVFECAEVRPSHTFGCITIILKDRV